MYHLQQTNIALTLHCAPRALPVLVNREEIRQVILNLLLNAEHAIVSTGAGGGSIVLETLDADGAYSVEVSDSGPGISPELRAASSSRSSRRAKSARAPASACRFPSASFRPTAAR